MKFELEWFDVNEKLPPRNDVVLVNYKRERYADYMPQIQTSSSEYLYKGGVGSYTHWAYLPPSPELT